MRNIALLAAVASLVGCSSNINYTKYTAPADTETATVKLKALDNYRNNDRVSLSIVTRPSCKEKLNFAEAAAVEKAGFFGADSFYEIDTKLPTNRPLNIHIRNISSGSQVTTHCQALIGLKFEPNKNYTIEVNNWSTEKSDHSGFGCAFKAHELDKNGNKIKLVKPLLPVLPSCES